MVTLLFGVPELDPWASTFLMMSSPSVMMAWLLSRRTSMGKIELFRQDITFFTASVQKSSAHTKNLSKHNMSSIQPSGLDSSDEELGSLMMKIRQTILWALFLPKNSVLFWCNSRWCWVQRWPWTSTWEPRASRWSSHQQTSLRRYSLLHVHFLMHKRGTQMRQSLTFHVAVNSSKETYPWWNLLPGSWS